MIKIRLFRQQYVILFLFSGLFMMLTAFEKVSSNEVYVAQKSSVYFQSDAPLEKIEARSSVLKGVIDLDKRSFAFSIDINSFEGFNSPLQKEHFNENYMESNRYPKALFTGKIIEKTDLNVPGSYTIRAKGKLNIHGCIQERIIKSTVISEDGILHIHANFIVLLEEHEIAIPKIVHQKIAEEIHIEIEAEFVKQSK